MTATTAYLNASVPFCPAEKNADMSLITLIHLDKTLSLFLLRLLKWFLCLRIGEKQSN
jgi:hypothetical protein